MQKLWNFVNEMKIHKTSKPGIFLFLLALISSLMGASFWLLFAKWLLSETEWLICFMSYPAIIAAFFVGIFYLYKHKFR